MSNVVVSEYLTLDGVMEAPEKWNGRFWNEEHDRYAHDQLWAADSLLLGRRTYETFAGSWPLRKGEFADRINGLPKRVVSTTLDRVEWSNSRLIAGDVAGEVSALRRQPGRDVLIYGSGELVRSLMEHDLVDEYRLWVHPVVLGAGKRLFGDGSRARLTLAETIPFSSGAVVLRYRPERTAGEP